MLLQDLHDFDDEGEQMSSAERTYRNYMRRFNNLVVAGGVGLEKILKIDLDGDGQVKGSSQQSELLSFSPSENSGWLFVCTGWGSQKFAEHHG